MIAFFYPADIIPTWAILVFLAIIYSPLLMGSIYLVCMVRQEEASKVIPIPRLPLTLGNGSNVIEFSGL
jgi:hypothetical protein